MYSKKLLVIGILFMFSLVGINYSFAGSGELNFDQSSLSIRLYCETPVINVIVSGDIYDSYTADIPFVDGITFVSPNQTSASAFGSKELNPNTCGSLTGCLRFVGSSSSILNGGNNGGTLTIQNSGYIRNTVVNFTGYRQSVQSVVSSGLTDYTTVNGLLSLSSINISLYPGFCTSDNDAPVFAFTGGMTPHVTNYTLPQFNDRIYVFNLTDDGGELDYGFYAGYLGDPWLMDDANGTTYSTGDTVLNGSGIDLSTFVFEIAVEDSPDAGTFTSLTFTGTLNYTGGNVITGSDSELLFYPYDFTWNRWNRNYTGSLTTGALWSSSSLDIDGNWTFGTEQEVIMTGIIVDRAGNTGTLFTRHFNYGAIPWSSNAASGALVQYCGPNGTQTIGVSTPTDSGAYISKYNDYFVLEPFKVYLHDDRAGVDSGSIVVTLSGMQGGVQTTITLTGNINPQVNLGLTPFTWVGPISIATAGNGTQSVYSVPGSDRNYETLINYTGQWDQETKIEVSVDYNDLVQRTGTQVTCDYYNTYAPYVNNRTSDINLKRTPFASGGVFSGFTTNFEDEWAGVDSGSIQLVISGRTIDNMSARTTAPLLLTFNSGSTIDIFSMLAVYDTHTGTISDGQNYNYTLTFVEATHNSGYFAPEHPITFTLTYTDRAGNVQSGSKQYSNLDTPASYGTLYSGNTAASSYGNTNSLLIDIFANPLLRRFSVISDPINSLADWFEAVPIGTHTSTSGNTQFSGFQYAVMDHWAGVDGAYNLVTIEGDRRGVSRTYAFLTIDSTLTGNAEYTTADLTGTMTKEAVLVTTVDGSDGQHPTQAPYSTGFKYSIASGDHSIYFDYGTYSGVTPIVSSYDVTIYGADLRPDDNNDTTWAYSLDLDSLQCKFLNRCSHASLTFVWGTFPDDNPLTGSIDNPFVGTRVSIVGSGVVFDTGNNIVYCAASEGIIESPITLDFSSGANLTGASTGSYQSPILKVADGLFELTGDILIVR